MSRNSEFIKFKIKNSKLAGACCFYSLPVRYQKDCATMVTLGMDQRHYFENIQCFEIPNGKSLSLWFAEVAKKGFLSDHPDLGEKIWQQLSDRCSEIDEHTETFRLEIGRSTDEESVYEFEERKKGQVTTYWLQDSEWDTAHPEEPLRMALDGDTVRLRTFAQKIGNMQVKTDIYDTEKEPEEDSSGDYPHMAEIPYEVEKVKLDDWKFTETKGTIKLTEYLGSDGDVYIPDYIGGLPVTSLGSRLFVGRKMDTLIMPDTLEIMGADLFEFSCPLKAVRFSKHLREIGRCAFHFCYIPILEIPESVTALKGGALVNLKPQQIVIHGDPKLTTNMDMFGSSDNKIVYAHKGTQVETYCIKHRIKFVEIE